MLSHYHSIYNAHCKLTHKKYSLDVIIVLVVCDVLSKRGSHTLGGAELSVEAYYDFLGRLILVDAPTPSIPGEPTHVQVDKDVTAKIEKSNTVRSYPMAADSDGDWNAVHVASGHQVGEDDRELEINELPAKADPEEEQAKQEIAWNSKKLQLFTLCGIKEQIEHSYPNLNIITGTESSSQGKTGLILEGTKKDVDEAELSMRRQMDSLDRSKFKAGSIKVRFVQHVCDKILEILGSQNIQAVCRGSDDGKIIIYGATKNDVSQAKAYIDNDIEEDVILIKGQSALAGLQGQKGTRLLEGINRQKFVMAHINQQGM